MYTSPQGHSCFIVALEGPDRLGKSTQARILQERLHSVRGKVEKSPYADGITYERIYEMLRTGEALSHPIVFQTLMGINRLLWQSHLSMIAKDFDVIVLDRWSPSTWVYGAEAGVAEATTACILQGILEPDLVLIFDGEPFPSPDEDDSYEANVQFQQNLRKRYRDWAKKPNARLIDARQSVETVTEILMAHIRGLL
jgi:thymidylate kinase